VIRPQMPPVIVSPYLRLPLRPLDEVNKLWRPTRAQPMVDVDLPTGDAFGVSDARGQSCTTPS
jgi:hypothetical protein